MVVLVPFTALTLATQIAVGTEGLPTVYHHCPEEDSYWETLSKWWKTAGGVLVVEQDIVPWPGALKQLSECPNHWCTFPYLSHIGVVGDALGCTKFSSELMLQVPDLFEQMDELGWSDATHSWRGLDRKLSYVLRRHGLQPHMHEPMVAHCGLHMMPRSRVPEKKAVGA